MSLNMYMMNLLNGVEALTVEIEENDNEILSIEENISEIKTNISSINTNKQDKLDVLTNLSINKVSCTEVLINGSNVTTLIDTSKLESTEYTNTMIAQQKANNKTYVASQIATAKIDVQLDINSFTDTKLATNKTESTTYTDTQVALVKSESTAYTDSIVTDIHRLTDTKLATNKEESTTYTDSQITSAKSYTDTIFSNVDFTFINDYIAAPTVDLAGKIVSDLSIMNKLYIDAKVQQIWNAYNGYHGKTDISLKGIHTIDLADFDLFTKTILQRTTVKIAQFKYTPINAKSRHNMFFNTPYRFPAGNASGADEIRSYARVYQDGTMKYQSYQPIQYFVGASGGGTRSGVIFPLQFSVKPQLLDGKEITIEIYIRNDSDDTVQVESTEGTWFTCTEIRGI